jgi:hypothetical protein
VNDGNGGSRKPSHRLKITGAVKDTGKNFWTTIGSGWARDDGTVSVTINEGLNLVFTKGTRLILAPVEEK